MKRSRKNNLFSRLIGVLLIITSVLVFTKSLKERMKRSLVEPTTVSERSDVRITADGKAGTLYLWGLNEGFSLKADVPITYRYEGGFYVISIDEAFKPYILEVFKGAELKNRFGYRPGESYPIFPY